MKTWPKSSSSVENRPENIAASMESDSDVSVESVVEYGTPPTSTTGKKGHMSAPHGECYHWCSMYKPSRYYGFCVFNGPSSGEIRHLVTDRTPIAAIEKKNLPMPNKG
jgi:hypothetical protein